MSAYPAPASQQARPPVTVAARSNTRADRLISSLRQQAREYAERVGATDSTIALQRECGLLAGELRSAIDELDRLKGVGQRPQAGCEITTLSLGESEVLVEYEFERAQVGSMNPDSPRFGPDIEASVNVIQVLINGEWIDPADHLAGSVIERWETELLEAESA